MVERTGRKRVVYLTGWAHHPGAHNIYKGCDLMLPLSDHPDYDELVRPARESGARQIFTAHRPAGFAERRRVFGLPAKHLGTHPQDLCDDHGEAPGRQVHSADQHSLKLQ